MKNQIQNQHLVAFSSSFVRLSFILVICYLQLSAAYPGVHASVQDSDYEDQVDYHASQSQAVAESSNVETRFERTAASSPSYLTSDNDDQDKEVSASRNVRYQEDDDDQEEHEGNKSRDPLEEYQLKDDQWRPYSNSKAGDSLERQQKEDRNDFVRIVEVKKNSFDVTKNEATRYSGKKLSSSGRDLDEDDNDRVGKQDDGHGEQVASGSRYRQRVASDDTQRRDYFSDYDYEPRLLRTPNGRKSSTKNFQFPRDEPRDRPSSSGGGYGGSDYDDRRPEVPPPRPAQDFPSQSKQADKPNNIVIYLPQPQASPSTPQQTTPRPVVQDQAQFVPKDQISRSYEVSNFSPPSKVELVNNPISIQQQPPSDEIKRTYYQKPMTMSFPVAQQFRPAPAPEPVNFAQFAPQPPQPPQIRFIQPAPEPEPQTTYVVQQQAPQPQVRFVAPAPEPQVRFVSAPQPEPQVRFVSAPQPEPQVRFVSAPQPEPQVRFVSAPQPEPQVRFVSAPQPQAQPIFIQQQQVQQQPTVLVQQAPPPPPQVVHVQQAPQPQVIQVQQAPPPPQIVHFQQAPPPPPQQIIQVQQAPPPPQQIIQVQQAPPPPQFVHIAQQQPQQIQVIQQQPQPTSYRTVEVAQAPCPQQAPIQFKAAYIKQQQAPVQFESPSKMATFFTPPVPQKTRTVYTQTQMMPAQTTVHTTTSFSPATKMTVYETDHVGAYSGPKPIMLPAPVNFQPLPAPPARPVQMQPVRTKAAMRYPVPPPRPVPMPMPMALPMPLPMPMMMDTYSFTKMNKLWKAPLLLAGKYLKRDDARKRAKQMNASATLHKSSHKSSLNNNSMRQTNGKGMPSPVHSYRG